MSTTQPATETYTMPANSEAWYEMAMKHNNTIRTYEIALIDLTAEVESKRRDVAYRELCIVQAVTAEVENGKPVYSNETSRKAETASRLENSLVYNRSKEALRQVDFRRQLVTIELAEAQRMFSLAKYGLRAQGA